MPDLSQSEFLIREEFSFNELLFFIWSDKVKIALISAFFAAGSVVYSLTLQDIYTSRVLLAPADEAKGGGLSALAGNFGGLASLAGINIGERETNKVDIAIATLKSRRFLKVFVDENQLSVPLIAAKKWDFEENEFVINPDLYLVEDKKWIRSVAPPKKTIPTDWEIYKIVEKIIDIDVNEKTGLVLISIDSISPLYSKLWLDSLVTLLNNYIKDNEKRQAKKSIQYLTEQMSKTNISEMKNIFSQLIEEQTKTLMLAETRSEYVFKIIDPGVIPEEKTRPSRALICILITFFGGLLGVFVSIVKFFFNQKIEKK